MSDAQNELDAAIAVAEVTISFQRDIAAILTEAADQISDGINAEMARLDQQIAARNTTQAASVKAVSA